MGYGIIGKFSLNGFQLYDTITSDDAIIWGEKWKKTIWR